MIVEKTTFEEAFSTESLIDFFLKNFSKDKARGIDGNSVSSFRENILENTKNISKKCITLEFEFSPYLQKLISKGSNSKPRIISIPTVRDQLVLSVLKKYLQNTFPGSVVRKLPNNYINDIKRYLSVKDNTTCFYRTDISNFYGSINREKLYELLKESVKDDRFIEMIRRSLVNVTVPSGTARENYEKFYREKGVPQGLSISNILAEIYLKNIDIKIRSTGKMYLRYVDDVIIFNSGENKKCLKRKIKNIYDSVDLDLNERKTFCRSESPHTFEYLGYKFISGRVTVRETTVAKLINALASKFTSYKRNVNSKIKKIPWLNRTMAKEIFIEELNLKISGAISEKNRYGWIFYFNEIDDISLLYRLDRIVEKLFRRLDDFENTKPDGVKKFSRSYYESKFNIDGGYILNFDSFVSKEDKMKFLISVGEINPSSETPYGDDEISKIYEKVKSWHISKLEKDVGLVY